MSWNNAYRKVSDPKLFDLEMKFYEMTLSRAQDAAATVMATTSSEEEKIEALGRFFTYRVMPWTKKNGKLPRSQSALKSEFESLCSHSGLDALPEEDDPRYETFTRGAFQAGQEIRDEQESYFSGIPGD